MKNIQPHNFYTVQGWMLDLDLSLRECVAFAIVYGFSQDNESQFKGSISYIQEWLCCSRNTAIDTMDSLVKKGYVIKKQESTFGVKFNRYSVDFDKISLVINNLEGGSAKIALPVQKLDGGSAKIRLVVQKLDYPSNKENNNNNIIIDNNKNKDITPYNNNSPLIENKRKSLELEFEGVEEVDNDELLFEQAWKDYGRKGSKVKAKRYWKKLTYAQKQEIISNMPAYIASTPDITYRKDFEGWINPVNELWKREIFQHQQQSGKENPFSPESVEKERQAARFFQTYFTQE